MYPSRARGARALTRGLLVLIALTPVTALEAQQRHFVEYTTASGLPEQNVRVVFQDREGFLWVGTASGIGRYDGRRFETLSKRDGLVDNTVTAIMQDADGRMLVGTAAGITVLQGLSVLEGSLAPFDDVPIRDLARLGDSILVAAATGLFRIDAGTPPRPLAQIDALAIATDAGNRVWLGGNGFVRRLENGRLGPPLPGLHTTVSVDDIVPGPTGDVWLATNAGLFRWNDTRFEIFKPDALDNPRALRMFSGTADREGNLWFGSWGGVAMVSERDTRFLTETEGLPDTTVQTTWADREGNVWFGTADGLAKLAPGPFATFTREQGLPSDRIHDVAGGPAGDLWVATSLGPVHLLPSGWIDSHPLALQLRYVRATATGVLGETVLVGTQDGLYVWEDGEGRRFRRGAGLPSSLVSEIAVAGQRAWIGLRPGIASWSRGRVQLPAGLRPLADVSVTALLEDARGRLWIGTERSGTHLYDPQEDRLLPLADEIAALDVLSLAEDGQGRVWLGTAGQGAHRLGDGTTLTLTSTTGLVDDFIRQIVVDSVDRTWFYTNRGLDRLEADGTVSHFDASEGLVSLEGSTGAVWRDPSERLWFGTGAGLVRYDPVNDVATPLAPPVAIRQITAGGEAVDLSDPRIPASRSDLRLEFAALSFRNEFDNRFSYRLIGGNEEWSVPRRQPEVTYGSLEPGTYGFEVIAVTPDGVRSAEPARFEFQVLPRLHETWWFRTLVIVGLLAASAAAYRWRAGHLEREQRRLARLVDDRSNALADQIRATEHVEAASRARTEFVAKMSHEIRTPINGVLGMADLLMFTPLEPRQRHLTRTIRRSGEALLSLVNDILDLSKIEAGKLRLETTEFDLVEAVGYVIDILAERARVKSVALRARIDPFVPADLLGDPVRLRQVLLNLVDNAIKFTDEGSVTLVVDLMDEDRDKARVRFRVEDTGIGISEEAQQHIFHAFEQADDSTTRKHGGTGLGLNIAQQLVEAMGGHLRLTSQPGKGTTFAFTATFGQQAAFRPREDLDRLPVALLGADERSATALSRPLGAWGADVRILERSTLDLAGPQLAAPLQGVELLLVTISADDRERLAWLRQLRDLGLHRPAVCVLMTPDTQRVELEEACAGHWELVTAPAGPRRLYAAVRQALAIDEAGARGGISAETAPVFQGEVLLVEDNVVNQEVSSGMLQHLGCSVRIVANGREAVEEYARSRFDLVLMDCEMPVMDGFDATRGIRALERNEKIPRTPVVALTANAASDYRSRCHDAGMDGFLSKPHTLPELIATLSAWLEARDGATAPVLDAATGGSEPESLDLSVLEQIRALQQPGEPDLLKRVVDSYLLNSRQLRADLEKAVQLNDADRLRAAAHSLKSASGNVGAMWVLQVCRRLENMGRAGDLRSAAETLVQLDEELEAVNGLLRRRVLKVANG